MCSLGLKVFFGITGFSILISIINFHFHYFLYPQIYKNYLKLAFFLRIFLRFMGRINLSFYNFFLFIE